jgi:hypothetical protein
LKDGEKMKTFENMTTTCARGRAEKMPGTADCRRNIFGGPAGGKKITVVSVFTPCAGWCRLLETGDLIAQNAAFGDVILLSPACSGFDQFQHQPSADEVSSSKMRGLADAMGGMPAAEGPNTQTAGKTGRIETDEFEKKVSALHRGFLRQNPGAKTKPNPTSQERTPTSAYNQ